MRKHILTRDVLECFMLTASNSSRLSTLFYILVFHSFFLVQNLTPEIPPENRYEVCTCISTYRTCTLSILINTLDQFLMPEEAFQTTGSVG